MKWRGEIERERDRIKVGCYGGDGGGGYNRCMCLKKLLCRPLWKINSADLLELAQQVVSLVAEYLPDVSNKALPFITKGILELDKMISFLLIIFRVYKYSSSMLSSFSSLYSSWEVLYARELW